MKIQNIVIKNYRLLKDFKIDLEDNLSLVIGKNNTGKTSLLSVIEKFLTDKSDFSINDFNLDTQDCLKNLENKATINIPDDFKFSIQLLFEIKYDADDNLQNLSSLILNLETEDIVVFGFEYFLNPSQFKYLIEDFTHFKKENSSKNIIAFLSLPKSSKYFKTEVRAYEYIGNGELGESQVIEDKKLVSRIINVQSIKAKREVNNSDSNKTDKTLSKLSSDYYESLENTLEEELAIKDLNKKLEDTDKELDKVYPIVFKEVIDKVQLFGGMKEKESLIKVISTLQGKNILKENTSVVYEYAKSFLPEDYNGLGYLNLFSIIFDLEIRFREFRKERELKEDQIPADINILFIEEPEAHTHPQMQHVFIKKITEILDKEKNGLDINGKRDSKKAIFNLQNIITTHSSHIVAESNFDDIKYFHKKNKLNQVESRNLKDLKTDYDIKTKQYQFLKQYLTLNRAELFFADKAILIEGDTERILLPAMMSKLDLEKAFDLPLLSQNISIVEVGAYAHIFEKFIDFIGIKYLLITDIDTYKKTLEVKKKDGKKDKWKEELCNPDDSKVFGTKNGSLKHFIKKDIKELINSKENILVKNDDLCIAFQHKEENYHASSFEDSFIHINLSFIRENKKHFNGIKNKKDFDLKGGDKKSPYELALNCIKKKTHFALDIIYHSNAKYSNWNIPSYIKEGLLWLQK
ncbi:ATP-dependent nuclease [Winogradskyella sediminis]|uniref:Predicted ATP-dependent endonuclease of the OLD family, contains P-loop ATPase and TOPRIM domains n=1 Tax=Winogradskyella sediminis TaxID=1382466 RepID=A0A1H1XJZ4_9FLAO|nr:ATP-dependent endonuclease [Winogradskyella sediminis]SDT09615.1 Predicted ATP-dependent endonuclease of the OLD family, contains P-loop ATPase and TOPRIM domains [Winogradskyella sediminis]